MSAVNKFMAEVGARLDKATPGPWGPCLGSGNHECTGIHFMGDEKHPMGLMVCDLIPDYMLDGKHEEDLKYKPANMELLINVPNDLRKLLEIASVQHEALMQIAQREYKMFPGQEEKCAEHALSRVEEIAGGTQ